MLELYTSASAICYFNSIISLVLVRFSCVIVRVSAWPYIQWTDLVKT